MAMLQEVTRNEEREGDRCIRTAMWHGSASTVFRREKSKNLSSFDRSEECCAGFVLKTYPSHITAASVCTFSLYARLYHQTLRRKSLRESSSVFHLLEWSARVGAAQSISSCRIVPYTLSERYRFDRRFSFLTCACRSVWAAHRHNIPAIS